MKDTRMLYSPRNMNLADQITKAVDVYPEGIEREYMHSVYFCPKERIHISTPARFAPKYVAKPDDMNWFSFAVKSRAEVHVILTRDHNNDESYHITLQNELNQSFISKVPYSSLLFFYLLSSQRDAT